MKNNVVVEIIVVRTMATGSASGLPSLSRVRQLETRNIKKIKKRERRLQILLTW